MTGSCTPHSLPLARVRSRTLDRGWPRCHGAACPGRRRAGRTPRRSPARGCRGRCTRRRRPARGGRTRPAPARGEASHLLPGVGLSGMRLTCTRLVPIRCAQERAEQVRTPRLVVDVADQRVLDRDAAARRGRVAAGGVEDLADLPAVVDRDQRVAQLVVRGVQGDGEGDRQSLGGQLVDRRDEPDGRDRDAARGDPEAVRGGVGDPPQRRDHALVVGQGLAHAHEHDVRQPRRLAQRAVAGRGGGLAHLVHDLGGGQVALAARPDRWRRTGTPSRSPPGWRCTPWPGPDSP